MIASSHIDMRELGPENSQQSNKVLNPGPSDISSQTLLPAELLDSLMAVEFKFVLIWKLALNLAVSTSFKDLTGLTWHSSTTEAVVEVTDMCAIRYIFK